MKLPKFLSRFRRRTPDLQPAEREIERYKKKDTSELSSPMDRTKKREWRARMDRHRKEMGDWTMQAPEQLDASQVDLTEPGGVDDFLTEMNKSLPTPNEPKPSLEKKPSWRNRMKKSSAPESIPEDIKELDIEK